MHEQLGAGQACRGQDRLAEVEEDIAVLLAMVARGLVEQEQVLDLGHEIVAAGMGHRLGVVALDAITAVAHQVVPQHFETRLGNRKRCGQLEVGDAVTVLDQLGRGRVRLDRVVDLLRVRG